MQNYSNIEKSGKFNSFEYKEAREKKTELKGTFEIPSYKRKRIRREEKKNRFR